MTGRRLPPRHVHPRSVALLTGLGLSALLLVGCSTPADTAQPETAPAEPVEAGVPVEVVEAVLNDEMTAEQNGRISWTTTWRACFERDGGNTTRFEAQAVTTEGAGTSLRKMDGQCLELDIASGVNDAAAGMLGRDIQLAEASTLAYRVRAVLDDGAVTPWTEPIRVGATRPPG
ncbi:hypothetical protein [Cryobacterium sp. Y57]|uniref:hypothetical protein n=1 Tax=Cryobacterium sp. Y57 TaxID=2048287 RepID=UPI000CE3EEEE|nr:hypothetical protein [Cryobacterium sp. Y57]